VCSSNNNSIFAAAFNILVLLQELIFSNVGETSHDEFTHDVAISGDGRYSAPGAPRGDPNGLSDPGYARLYAKSGTDWNMLQQINGIQSDHYFGRSLDLSHDGSMLTVGAMGVVYMYKLSNSTFLYELIHIIDNIGGLEVSVSGDGIVVGVTSQESMGAKILERIGDGFQQRGTDILGYGRAGGIALNYNGTIVIVDDAHWDSGTTTDRADGAGRAGVFQWKDDEEDGSMQWMQMGSYITGNFALDYLGFYGCVSITHDGLTVAVGAQGPTKRGLVRVYNHDSLSDTWKQSGSDLVGDDAEDSFSKTSFSSDGTYLAVGTWNGNYVKMLERMETTMKHLETRSLVKEETLDPLLTCQPTDLPSSLAVIKVKYICTIPFRRHPEGRYH